MDPLAEIANGLRTLVAEHKAAQIRRDTAFKMGLEGVGRLALELGGIPNPPADNVAAIEVPPEAFEPEPTEPTPENSPKDTKKRTHLPRRKSSMSKAEGALKPAVARTLPWLK